MTNNPYYFSQSILASFAIGNDFIEWWVAAMVRGELERSEVRKSIRWDLFARPSPIFHATFPRPAWVYQWLIEASKGWIDGLSFLQNWKLRRRTLKARVSARFESGCRASLVTLLSDSSPSPLIAKYYARLRKDEEKSQKVSVCRAESF